MAQTDNHLAAEGAANTAQAVPRTADGTTQTTVPGTVDIAAQTARDMVERTVQTDNPPPKTYVDQEVQVHFPQPDEENAECSGSEASRLLRTARNAEKGVCNLPPELTHKIFKLVPKEHEARPLSLAQACRDLRQKLLAELPEASKKTMLALIDAIPSDNDAPVLSKRSGLSIAMRRDQRIVQNMTDKIHQRIEDLESGIEKFLWSEKDLFDIVGHFAHAIGDIPTNNTQREIAFTELLKFVSRHQDWKYQAEAFHVLAKRIPLQFPHDIPPFQAMASALLDAPENLRNSDAWIDSVRTLVSQVRNLALAGRPYASTLLVNLVLRTPERARSEFHSALTNVNEA